MDNRNRIVGVSIFVWLGWIEHAVEVFCVVWLIDQDYTSSQLIASVRQIITIANYFNLGDNYVIRFVLLLLVWTFAKEQIPFLNVSAYLPCYLRVFRLKFEYLK